MLLLLLLLQEALWRCRMLLNQFFAALPLASLCIAGASDAAAAVAVAVPGDFPTTTAAAQQQGKEHRQLLLSNHNKNSSWSRSKFSSSNSSSRHHLCQHTTPLLSPLSLSPNAFVCRLAESPDFFLAMALQQNDFQTAKSFACCCCCCGC